MNEGYDKGSKCLDCGRTVEESVCSACNGTGSVQWLGHCERCEGTGIVIMCPVSRKFVTFGDWIKGVTCKDYDDEGKRK